MLGAMKNIRRTKNAKRVVAKAADLFEAEPERWQQSEWVSTEDGETYNPEAYFSPSCEIDGICKVCLEGALLIYSKDQDTYNAAIDLVLDYLNEELGADITHPFSFNDSSSTRVTDVVKVLRAVVARKR